MRQIKLTAVKYIPLYQIVILFFFNFHSAFHKKMETDKIHIRHLLLFFFRKGLSSGQTRKEICEVYGEEALSVRTCERWFGHFRASRFDLSDLPRSGRPSKVDDDILRSIIEEDPKLTSYQVAETLGVAHSTVLEHLHKIGKVNKAGVWVAHELSQDNLNSRITICSSLLSRQRNLIFLDRIVTGDEKWVMYVNVKKKRQWLDPGQPPEPTPKQGLHPKKIMLCVWWDIHGIIHHELLRNNQTVTAELYCQQMIRLREELQKNTPFSCEQKGRHPSI